MNQRESIVRKYRLMQIDERNDSQSSANSI